jgi:hypothetical protein
MTVTATLMFCGADGPDGTQPDPIPTGKDGPPLGPAGNGEPGKADLFGLKCEHPAGIGHPGNDGGTAPPANSGTNGESAPGGRFTCDEFVGPSLDVWNHGGNGGHGANAGLGGNGSPGGNAGIQPKACRDVIAGGSGGRGGMGGRAGSGGDAGSGGNLTVLLGADLPSDLVSVDSKAGRAGNEGQPGGAGTPGASGKNSDGTLAPPAGQLGPGLAGHPGKPGVSGSVSLTSDSSMGPTAILITILPMQHG